MYYDNKFFVLCISLRDSTGLQEEEVFKYYTTKQGLIQGAHYWARYYFDGDLWRGGYYHNYVLTTHTSDGGRVVMYAYQERATKDFQSLAIELTTIVSRKGLGEDVRGEAYKEASSIKGTAK